MAEFDFKKMEEEIREAERNCTEAYNTINNAFFNPIVDIEKLDREYEVLKEAYKKRNEIRTKYSRFALRSEGYRG